MKINHTYKQHSRLHLAWAITCAKREEVTTFEEKVDNSEEVAKSTHYLSSTLLDKLDARIEAVLHQVLPSALSEYLRPSVSQTMGKLLLESLVKDGAEYSVNHSMERMMSNAGTVQAQPRDLRQGIRQQLLKVHICTNSMTKLSFSNVDLIHCDLPL